MNKIKYFALVIVMLATMPACRHESNVDSTNSWQDSITNELNDSLATALAEKDSLMALMNEINDGVTKIKELEDIVSVADLNHETPDRREQLRSDMQVIQNAINERRQRLAELEKRLAQSTHYTASMKKTIEGLKQQLNSQQRTIDSLGNELKQAHIVIDNLNKSVDSLNTVNTAVVKEKEQAQQETKRLNEEVNELNTCYYVVGSKKELKANKIMETGFLRKTRILEGDFEKSYFTQADKRTLTEVPLHSKKAEVMTHHPEGSYQLVDNGNIKTLRILDPKRFWEQSNYLVIKVE